MNIQAVVGWAKENRYKHDLASFIFMRCPQDSERYPDNRQDWVAALINVIEERGGNVGILNNLQQSGISATEKQTVAPVVNTFVPYPEQSVEEKKAEAVLMKQEGCNTQSIANVLGVTTRTVQRWLKDCLKGR